MAAVNHNPSGFSYAQAARGQSSVATSQTSASKPAATTSSASIGILADVTTPRSNWADDVEASVSLKSSESQKARQDELGSSQPKESLPDRAKLDDKTVNGASSVSSPDLAASVSSATKEEYDILSPPNGSSSESTWEMASQVSESWIVDREKKQSASQTRERPSKEDKRGKDPGAKPAPKPVVLHDAPPPPVNPWLKRAEEAKAKAIAQPLRSPGVAPSTDSNALKENQRPRADSRRKANSVASIPSESLPSAPNGIRSENASQNKRAYEPRSRTSHQNAEQDSESVRVDAPLANSSRPGPTERQSLPNLSTATSIAEDDSSWPTPDTAQEKERKESAEKDTEEKRDDEATPTAKRKKPEWKVLPVTPTIKFETPMMNERNGKPRNATNGERGGRGGGASRGRGGHRGTPNGANGAERQSSRTGSSPNSRDADLPVDSRARPSTSGNDSTSQYPKRASSESSWREQKHESAAVRSFSGQTTGESATIGRTLTREGSSQANVELKPSTQSQENLRSESPKKIDDAESDRDIVPVPSPIPPPSSKVAQIPGAEEATETTPRDMPPPRMHPGDSRRDSRSLESSRDTTGPAPRGGSKRGGRGRGGVRDFLNGQSGGHTYPGPYADFLNPSAYGVFSSNSTYSMPRAHHQYNFATPNRGGWNNRGNPRSQSIPIDNNYYSRTSQYPGGVPPPIAIPAYQPGMFDNPPMTAMPYPMQMDTQYVIQMVATQLDYYFSVDNLLKDMFLRKHMDSQGFVFLDIVANFNRVRQLTPDRNIIKVACMNSSVIEIRVGDDGKERLRKAEGWEQFLLPMEQREESAQNNGPEHSQRPERPQLQIPEPPSQFRGPASAGNSSGQHARLERRSYDSAYPTMNGGSAQYAAFDGIPEVMYGDMNGEESRGRAAKSPIHETPVSPLTPSINSTVDEADLEPDAFPDSQAELLTVVVKMSQPTQRPPQVSLSSRTFSNGSIDAHTIMGDGEEQAVVNGTDSRLSAVAVPRRPSPNKPRSGERTSSNSELEVREVRWVKDQEVTSTKVRDELTSEPYLQLRAKALDQRSHAATGTCPYDMDVLYQFWCHFLIRNFNNNMYTEFMTLANEDAKQRHNLTGMQNLLKFYDHSFRSKNTIRNRIVQDYVKLVKNEPAELQSAVFKQLRAAWRDGAISLKNRKKLLDLVDKKFADQLEKLEF